MRSLALRVLFSLTLAVAALHFASRESQAGWPCGGYGFYPGLQYSIYGQDYIPYFSRHPPVYYSYPVARTYGWSPYAYPPGVMTPEYSSAPEPVTVVNPHVERAKSSVAKAENTARVEPLRIRNPYVEESLVKSDETNASTPVAVEVRKPKVVYPSATN